MNDKALAAILALMIVVTGAFIVFQPHIVSIAPPATSVAPTQPSISRSEQAVLDEGYTDPVEAGVPLLACSDSDSVFFNRAYDAKNENGKTVHLNVCCGLFKGCTIRH